MRSTLTNLWSMSDKYSDVSERQLKNFILNFGPQHPASHGVLRLVLQLNGELIERADPHIGFLHRGTEKLMEDRIFLKGLPYFDRLDYVSMMTQEHAYCLAIEDMIGSVSQTSTYTQVRVMFDELTRLLNHFLAISTHSLDVGNMSPLFWAFEEREKLMEFYERVSGARMHAAFYRPNSVNWSGLDRQFFLDVAVFALNSYKSITEIFTVLGTNKIWKSRLVDIGSVDTQTALSYGATGVVARSTGFPADLRVYLNSTYSFYWYLKFASFLGKRGDSFDRFLIRIREMYESINLVFQVLASISSIQLSSRTTWGFINSLQTKHSPYTQPSSVNTRYLKMEALIDHFKHYSEGVKVPRGVSYQSVEAPKGEFGVTLFSDGSPTPYRCKIRTPALNHLHMMPFMLKGHFFADMITVLGSQDIVFGEVDR